MEAAHTQHEVQHLLPARPLRAAMLAFIAALACLEVSAGVVVSEAWRQREQGTGGLELYELDEMLARLRALEGVVVIGAVVLTMLWSFVAVHNAARVGRNTRSALFAMVSWVLAPIAMLFIGRADTQQMPLLIGIGTLTLQAGVLWLPFGTIGSASAKIGGQRAPFFHWYMAMLLGFVVFRVFTQGTDVLQMRPSEDLGTVASMSLVNGVVIGVMMMMAAEASRSMQQATAEKLFQRQQLRDDAFDRFRHAAHEHELMQRVTAPHA